jgi:hypothetical protein
MKGLELQLTLNKDEVTTKEKVTVEQCTVLRRIVTWKEQKYFAK